MDGKIDTVREALNELQGLIHHIERTTGHEYDSRKLHAALAALSAIDPEAIKRKFWDELHAEAEVQYDRRLNLLGPIETLDDAAFRKTLGDGWSAWLLAKRIIENRRAAILSTEPAQDTKIVIVQGGTCGCTSCPLYPKPTQNIEKTLSDGRTFDQTIQDFYKDPAQDDGKTEDER